MNPGAADPSPRSTEGAGLPAGAPPAVRREFGPPRLTLQEWRAVLLNVKRDFTEDQITIIAGNIAFAGVISFFPVMIAIVSLYGMISDPRDLPYQLRELSATVPSSARTLLYDQMREIVSSPATELGLRLVISLIVTLVAGSGGMHALINGINLAYDRKETRSYFRIRLLAVSLTFGVVAFTVVAFALIALFPHLLTAIGLEPFGRFLLLLGRWPGLALVLMVGLSLVYRIAPNGPPSSRRWLTFGAVFATIVWMLASLAFGAYSANFAHYNKTYGALAGMVVFMLWIYISTLAILVGAEIDAELARFVSQRMETHVATSPY